MGRIQPRAAKSSGGRLMPECSLHAVRPSRQPYEDR